MIITLLSKLFCCGCEIFTFDEFALFVYVTIISQNLSWNLLETGRIFWNIMKPGGT